MKPLLMIALATAAFAQSPAEKFSVRVGKVMKGTEEYRITKTAEGYRVSGHSALIAAAVPQEFTEELLLGADRNLRRYRLEVSGGAGTQLIEARRNGDKVQMQATVGDENASKSVPFHLGMVVLDNLVTSHFQTLLDSVPAKADSVDLEIIVPQQMAVIKGKLQVGPEEAATLNGARVMTRKYVLQGTVAIDIWAVDGKLMRVHVASQDVEIVREGFELPKTVSAAAKESICRSRDIVFPSGDFQMPGTLCLPPHAKGRVPVVILVQGSGSHDRDETIGPNKPFRDIAEGLAASGIATLRYDKRTWAFRARIDKNITVEEEVIADAVAALAHARTLPEVDPKLTFVLGHSLGGSMAPFIAARSPEIHGVILLAGAARPLDELIYEQTAFQAKVQGHDEETIAREVGMMKKTFARVRSGEATDSETVMGAPVHYWRDILGRDTLAEFAKSKQPVLVLQGGRDVQVRRADYDMLNATLGARGEPHYLASLNHLFMPAPENATGAEYQTPSHVDPEVIALIAKFVKR